MVWFWMASALAVALAIASLGAMRSVVRGLSDVAFEDTSDMVAAQRLREEVVAVGREARGYLVTGDAAHLAKMAAARQNLAERFSVARALMSEPDERAKLAQVEREDAEYQAALDRAIAKRRSGSEPRDVALAFEIEVQPARDDVNQAFAGLASFQERRLRDAKAEARQTISRALVLLASIAGFALFLTVALGAQLTRSLRALREERLSAAQHLAEVEMLNRELDAFTGRVSHDIRNLLSPIALAAAMLPREIGQVDRIRALGDRIQRGIDRALALMNGLLAFSRSGAPDPDAACSVAAVVDETLEQLSPLTAQVDAKVMCRVEDVEVICSRELLNVVMLNVLGNALKYMAGCERRDLSISSRVVEGSCELTVADTGPGIPSPSLAHIFEPFFRVPGSRQPGSGLGLATVARIVHAHGGRIAVESAVEAGTTFRILLPILPAASLPQSPCA